MSYSEENSLNGTTSKNLNGNVGETMKNSTDKNPNGGSEEVINNNIDAIITLIKHLADSTDEFGRAEIQNALRETAYSMETPFQTTMRMSLDVCQVALARVAADMGLFKFLATSGAPHTVDALAEHFNAGRDLMVRIMRYVASVGMVKETGKDEYMANNMTMGLAVPGYEAAIRHAFENLCPLLMALPDYLAENNYQDIVDSQNTVFQNAFSTDQHCFSYIAHQPKRIANFQVLMTVERSPNWLSTFPMEREIATWSARPEKALFVDIGGGMGQACIQLKTKYPSIPGRVILQELPPFIQAMQKIDNVEFMAYNFFTPQPVKGAKFYFLRLILRDWPDDTCVDILNNLVPAMEADSRIIIDDGVVPETGAKWDETGTDICIMAALASRERTQKQWEALAGRAGLQLRAIYPYTRPVVNAAMVFARK